MNIQLLKQIEHLSLTESANQFFYFLSNAPILKKFFHSDLVEEYEAKEGISLAIITIRILKAFIYKIVYVFIVCSLLANVSNEAYFHSFFFMTLIGTMLRSIIRFDENDYTVISLLHMNEKEYVKYRLNLYIVKELLTFSFAYFFLSKIFEISYLYLFISIFLYLGMHLYAEMLRFKNMVKNNYLSEINKKQQNLMIIAIITCLLMIGAVQLINYFYLIDISFIMMKVYYLVTAVFSMLGIYAYRYLNQFKDYKKIFKYNLTLDKINQSNVETSKFGNIVINLKQMSDEIQISKIDNNKHGYNYISAAFDSRYGKSFNKSTRTVLIITVVVGLCALIIPFFLDDYIRHNFAIEIIKNLRILFYVIYMYSLNSKKYTLSCFLQIDRYLVNYHFFRRRNDIAKNYLLRLKEVIKITMIPSVLLIIFLLLIYAVHTSSISITNIIILIVFPLALAMFYSIYSLSTYYLFQPYDKDGTLVNKAYTIFDYLVYMLSYALFQIHVEFSIKVLIIIIVVFVLVSIALFLSVLKFAPKQFRVR